MPQPWTLRAGGAKGDLTPIGLTSARGSAGPSKVRAGSWFQVVVWMLRFGNDLLCVHKYGLLTSEAAEQPDSLFRLDFACNYRIPRYVTYTTDLRSQRRIPQR
ncbi:hypothetical protein VTG60DRAFT_5289 [Thermothelomyces hinnuleus]